MRRLRCDTCCKVTKHNKVPCDDIYECEVCGGLRKVDGITPSLARMLGVNKE